MLNNCNFIGHLGKDPEVGVTASGLSYARASIAISKKYKNAKGEKVETTEWVRLVYSKDLADICGKYCKKGDKLFVSGEMHTSEYEKDNVKRYSTEIIVNKLIMLSGKKDGTSNAPDESTAPTGKKGGTPIDPDQSTQTASNISDGPTDDLPF